MQVIVCTQGLSVGMPHLSLLCSEHWLQTWLTWLVIELMLCWSIVYLVTWCFVDRTLCSRLCLGLLHMIDYAASACTQHAPHYM
jgi:hypothetical protein